MEQITNAGRATEPIPLTPRDEVIRLKGCPDCDGRGYFLINPFATGGGNGCGGVGNLCQCQTCKAAETYWNAHGKLPAELLARMK